LLFHHVSPVKLRGLESLFASGGLGPAADEVL
jgi:hypothetical protein